MERVIAVVGPTAAGKTELSIALAEALNGEIINADALQVYRGLDIGTAKPPLELRQRVPHHLIDILPPDERFSAGAFARRARQAVEAIRGRRRVPIIVGGSGLYLRALLEGISPIPPADPKVRTALQERLQAEGLPALYEELGTVDPVTAARLAPGDRQRVLRALEVAQVSGQPLSAWIRRQPFGATPLAASRIGLTVPRSILYDRIAARVAGMVARGWVGEVAELLEAGIDPQAPAFQAIGYRQMVRHVVGEWSLQAAIDDTIRATRRYAKRQLTWFRKEGDIRWIPAQDLPASIPSLLRALKGGGRLAQ